MFLSRRDLRTVALVTGLLGSESVNYVLKKIIKQPRPDRELLAFEQTCLATDLTITTQATQMS